MRDRAIVGRGRTQAGGRPNAERVALDDAGDRARSATLYVTLEPCCHWGTTPPCADAIIAAGVSAVHACLQDPDPRVNGGGFRKLREAGIRFEVGEPSQSPAVPERFDACLAADDDGTWLLERGASRMRVAGCLRCSSDAERLLEELGRRGLTNVFVAVDDEAASLLAAGANGGARISTSEALRQ